MLAFSRGLCSVGTSILQHSIVLTCFGVLAECSWTCHCLRCTASDTVHNTLASLST